ncbi:MAG: hypothetical protein AAFY66_11930 [Pseudomonadota bacterium]
MAHSLADLTKMRDALISAIAGGAREVEFRDRKVTYRSHREMIAARRDLDRQIAELAGRPSPRIIHFTTSKGT